MILINHQKSKIILEYEEVIEYDGDQFISDAGEFLRLFQKIYTYNLSMHISSAEIF